MQLEGKAKRIGPGVAVPAALVALGVELFGWNMLRGFVSRQGSERTVPAGPLPSAAIWTPSCP